MALPALVWVKVEARTAWAIDRVETDLDAGKVHVWVALPQGERWVCPECQAAAPQDRGRHPVTNTNDPV